MKKHAISVSILLILFLNFIAFAQDEGVIEYGQIVNGEITNREFEIPYVFTGEANDVIVIEMKQVDPLGKLNNPEIILLNPDGDILADTSKNFSFGGTLLAFEIDSKGEYTILATRKSGRAGDSVGEFTLALTKPTVLEIGQPMEASISSKAGDNYYTIRGEDTALDLLYQKTEGEFAPQITINRISKTNGLAEVVNLSGSELERGQMNVPSGTEIYLVKLGSAPFDFHFNEVTATYSLELIKSK